MNKLLISSAMCGMVAVAFSASANNLEYMVNPTAKDHKVPTKVAEKATTDDGQKTYKVTYETSAESLNATAPAAGPKSGNAQYDHMIGH